MAKKITKRDFDKDIQNQLDFQNQLIALQKEELNQLSNIFSLKSKVTNVSLDILKAEKELNASLAAYQKLQDDIQKGQATVGKTTLDNIKKEQLAQQKTINQLKTKEKILRSISNMGFGNLRAFGEELNKISVFSDKPIREAALQLGFGAEKAQLIRDAFYKATPQAQILGATMQDLAAIQTSYVDESGRALALTSDQLVNITEIAKGTGIAVSEAGKLAAQFEMLGMDTKRTHETIQGIVDSSERMGVNTQKVLKNVGDNFKRLNTFAFKDGIKGMAKMAQYSEKFKIDMSGALDSAKEARTLEGAIKMASELQILGGEFAKADPFELFHLSRNDPAKYTQKLNEMVKGMSSLVKTADGFKMQTSPQDLDRLKVAAEAMGVPFENLVEQSQRMGEIQAMNRQMMGTAFSKEDREAIQSMAKLDSATGIYKVLGKDISKLSAQEIESLKVQQKTLKERAEASQTFDEKFQNTIESMKYTLLPILDGINYMFDMFHPIMKSVSEAMQGMPDWTKKGLAIVGGLVGASLLISKSIGVFKSIPFLGKLVSGGGIGGGATKTAGGALTGGAASAGGGGGMAALGKGAGVGVAAAGIGAGIGLAAVGISKMAAAFKELDPKQLDALNQSLKTMGLLFGGVFAAGLLTISILGPAATVPLLALGAAALGIGVGIGVAAAGIGYMAKGFSELMTAAEPDKVFQLAAGIGALGIAMAGLASGSVLTLFAGGGAFAMLGLLSTRADAFERIGKAMKEIGVVMNSDGEGLTKLKQTLDSINNVKSSGGMLGELKDIIKNGIKVEFKDKNVALNVDVTTKIDSDVVARAVAKKIVVLHKEYQDGKSGK